MTGTTVTWLSHDCHMTQTTVTWLSHVTWLCCLLQCFIDIGAIFDRGLKVSDETIVLHKCLHLLWCNLSMTLWTIVLYVWVEGGRGREWKRGRKERERRKQEELTERSKHHHFMIVLLSYWQCHISHMTSHDTPTLLTSSMSQVTWPHMTHPPYWLAVCHKSHDRTWYTHLID